MANEKFKINGVVSEVVPTIGTTGDILKKTVSGVEWGPLAKATQTEAEAGTNDTKLMTPLRVKQAVAKLAPIPNYPVTSVNTKTGAVTISKSDVGLGNVNNVAITDAQVTKLANDQENVFLTQTAYDSLTTIQKSDPLKLYFITG